MEANAFRLSRAYLGMWSSNSSAALQQVSSIYGPRVPLLRTRSESFRSPGREEAIHSTLANTPIRASTGNGSGFMFPSQSEMHASWSDRLANREPETRGSSSRSSWFVQGFDFSTGRPLIVSESGSVLKKGRRPRAGKRRHDLRASQGLEISRTLRAGALAS